MGERTPNVLKAEPICHPSLFKTDRFQSRGVIFRFAPNNGHSRLRSECPLCANGRHRVGAQTDRIRWASRNDKATRRLTSVGLLISRLQASLPTDGTSTGETMTDSNMPPRV